MVESPKINKFQYQTHVSTIPRYDSNRNVMTAAVLRPTFQPITAARTFVVEFSNPGNHSAGHSIYLYIYAYVG